MSSWTERFTAWSPRGLRLTRDAIAIPLDAAGQLLLFDETERGHRFPGRGTGYVEEPRDAPGAVHDWNDDLADFVDQPGFEPRAVEGAAALEEKLTDSKRLAQLPQCCFRLDLVAAAEQVRDPGGPEVREIVVAHPLADQQNHVVAVDVATLES